MNLNHWTLFLDRDGVINEKLENDYVKNWDEFKFCNFSLLALAELSKIFHRIIIVTNQRGIGKGLMTEQQLSDIHQKMLVEIHKASGRIDKIYYCTSLEESADCRKPNVGMGLLAKKDFPEIDFSKSIIIGDSDSDMEFGKRLGMKSVKISVGEKSDIKTMNIRYNFRFGSLFKFSQCCNQLVWD